MKYRKFGNTGLEISEIGFGAWAIGGSWGDQPKALEILHKMKSEGLIKQIGISTPEHDQNCVVQLMREGFIDVLQVIYNIFEQEPAAQILPVAKETGKYKGDERFA